MPFTCEEREHQCVIRLQGEIDVTCSAELKRCLVEAISQEKDLAVDLSGVADLDVTALQLLWAAMQAAEKVGRAFSFPNDPPENIKTSICDSGFEPLLSPHAPGRPEAASEAADD